MDYFAQQFHTILKISNSIFNVLFSFFFSAVIAYPSTDWEFLLSKCQKHYHSDLERQVACVTETSLKLIPMLDSIGFLLIFIKLTLSTAESGWDTMVGQWMGKWLWQG